MVESPLRGSVPRLRVPRMREIKGANLESMEPENTIPDFQTHYADMVSRLSRMLDSVKKILQRLPGILIYLLGKAILTG